MTDHVAELVEAARGLLPFIRASTDPYAREPSELALKRLAASRGDQLREEAEQADRHDAAVHRFREALISFATRES